MMPTPLVSVLLALSLVATASAVYERQDTPLSLLDFTIANTVELFVESAENDPLQWDVHIVYNYTSSGPAVAEDTEVKIYDSSCTNELPDDGSISILDPAVVFDNTGFVLALEVNASLAQESPVLWSQEGESANANVSFCTRVEVCPLPVLYSLKLLSHTMIPCFFCLLGLPQLHLGEFRHHRGNH